MSPTLNLASWRPMAKNEMLDSKKDLILSALQAGTGAAIGAAIERDGLRAGVRLWFADLDDRHGPVAELRPYGLGGYRAELSFGMFSGAVIEQIRCASSEDVQLARALVESIREDANVKIGGQSLSDWCVRDGSFRLTATVRGSSQPRDDGVLVATCNEVLVPMMAAMAELIGYDVIEDSVDDEPSALEGAVSPSVVRRRERNPRNRLLCIRIHGEKCSVCGVEPRARYGLAGGIIEVHHLEPLALATAPRPYDPRTDLVPLCPSCHRASHTRRPIPFAPEELRTLMDNVDA
jgi:5-methylcytosine-specific restriction protein A